ncbi:MAG: Transcriptional regulator [Bacteroidetes bacterium]|nr:Transcriptional regulator [Bacteroidota bacterium]
MNNTILVIDDCHIMRETTCEVLRLANYNVLTAGDGKEGLDIIRKNLPDLILCDILMPNLDGYGVLRALENIPGTFLTPFIFISSKAKISDFRNGMDLGADDYLTKPFSGDDLLRIVGSRLKKSLALKESFKNTQREIESFFNGAKTLKDINLISDKIPVKKLKKKETLYSEGDKPNYVYYLVSGKMKTFKINEHGKEYITQIYKEGEFFGHQALLNNNEHKESAMSISNSEIGLILKQDFYQILSSNTQISLNFIKHISEDLDEAKERLLHLAYNSGRKKVAEALLLLNTKYNQPGDVKAFPANRENLSALAGISPESVSRHISDFCNEYLIQVQNSSITITNYQKLKGLKN